MLPDDEICYCYHVSLRKLVNYARRECPKKPSQMSQCLGAGTGCGWCIPILKRIAAEHPSDILGDQTGVLALTPDEYANHRKTYIKSDQPKNRFQDNVNSDSEI